MFDGEGGTPDPGQEPDDDVTLLAIHFEDGAEGRTT